MVERTDLRRWCEDAGFACRDGESDDVLHVRYAADEAGEVTWTLPDDDAGPLRLTDEVTLPRGASLPRRRLEDVVEGVVLGRSAMVDARVDRAGERVEVVVLVHLDAAGPHHVLAALYEAEKVGLLLVRAVDAAVAAEEAVASLEALASPPGRPPAPAGAAPGPSSPPSPEPSASPTGPRRHRRWRSRARRP